MKTQALLFTLLDDIVFSERAATTGGHQTLDFIPGATLLGSAAARLYSSIGSEAAYDLFHSGKVRFGNGLPLVQGYVAYPVPLSWHYSKRDNLKLDDDGFVLLDHIANFGRKGGLSVDAKPEQIRTGYITAERRLVRPARAFRMKTAIALETGRAETARLFGYQALAAGQTFVATITADDEVGDLSWEKLQSCFKDDVTLRLGRSRRSEFGRVACAPLDRLPQLPPSDGAGGCARSLTLWLLSDLAVEDDHGSPCTQPRPELLGLPSGRLMRTSFIRTRRYSPYNGFLRRHDIERVVIAQGSVLEFEFDADLTASIRAEHISRGLGLYREAGLGSVIADPAWLMDSTPQIGRASETIEVKTTISAAGPDDPYADGVIAWLSHGSHVVERRGEIERIVVLWLGELETLYESGRSAAGVRVHDAFGPGSSQWGRVLDLARNASSDTTDFLMQNLFDGASAICTQTDNTWMCSGFTETGKVTFRDWLADCIVRLTRPPATGDERTARTYAPRDVAYALGVLAGQARARISRGVVV